MSSRRRCSALGGLALIASCVQGSGSSIPLINGSRDALAIGLVSKLMKPGAWLVMDDLNFRFRGCQVAQQSMAFSISCVHEAPVCSYRRTPDPQVSQPSC
jgi:hypothetical protein